MSYRKAFLLTASLLLACAPGADSAPAESEDAVIGVGGKADGAVSSCQLDAVLSMLNEDSTDADALKRGGLHGHAANSLWRYRRGEDGSIGGKDDERIESLEELDAVPWVGPVAFEQLLSMVDGACESASSVEVIFSPQPDRGASHLARVEEEIEGASNAIDIAIYSFRDAGIEDALERAVKRGVRLRVIYEAAGEHEKDPQGTLSARLEELGADVRYVNKIMHHKFALIDGPRDQLVAANRGVLISGSANWSSSAATRYDENTMFARGNRELNLRFQREFNQLWEHSREFGDVEPWVSSKLVIEEAMIDDDTSVDAIFTSANFDTRFSDRFGETFTRVRGRDAVSNFLVERIQRARSSIWIASGHMRSRPVAEALIAKKAAAPNIDIRVYLDGQEYISAFWDQQQREDLDDCLIEAEGSDARTEDCIDKGFYYGLELHRAGIDVRYKYYSYRWHYAIAPQMHHKYLIIDGQSVLQGSYNLSSNAEHNSMENMAEFSGAQHQALVEAYRDNFETLWGTGEQEGRFDALMEELRTADEEIPLVFDPMALDWDQVTAIKDVIFDRCEAINSEPFRQSPERHFTCPL